MNLNIDEIRKELVKLLIKAKELAQKLNKDMLKIQIGVESKP